MTTPVAILGSGNIGTDLMIKILRLSNSLETALMVGIDPASDGLARASRMGVRTTHEGIDGLLALPDLDQIRIVFDATSASAHRHNADKLSGLALTMIDLTPAAIGPYVVPSVNLDSHRDAANVNMVTCGGQATIPIVAAVSQVTPVPYAEIVASIASASAGPGTRANIDEFTHTTARAIESVGGAARGKAVIILNPADPPMVMRDTVCCLINTADSDVHDQIRTSVRDMVAKVAAYVPGYRLKQEVLVTELPPDQPTHTLTEGLPATHQVTVFLEVVGAAHYLPAYAGNLDIMTSAALQTAEHLSARLEGSHR